MKRKQTSVSYAPSTVKKALSILPILAAEKGGLGMMDLAKKIGLNRSTVYRLVSALLESGFVRQNPATQKYSLGLKIVELAGRMLSEMEVREVARLHLQKLTQLTNETTHLGILNKDGARGYEVIYIDKIDGPEAIGLLTSVGKTFPAYVTAMGKALMAYLPDEELDEALDRQKFEARTKNTITDKQAFRDHLKVVRSLGYAIDNEENRLNARCIGAPVFDVAGKAVAAVSISGPVFRMTSKRLNTLSKPLKATALEISRDLGYQPGASTRGTVP